MLEQPFPDEPWSNVVRLNDRSSRICWKTGTSTGFRDAWAVAFNSHYVIGAWLGNTNGSAAPRLIGAHAALPLVARIFRSLPVPPVPAWPSTEGRLCEVQICALSGLPKSPWCSRTATALFPAGQFLHRRCDVHRPGLDGTVGVYWPPTTRRWDLAKVPASEGAAVVVEEAGPSTGRQRKLSIKRPVQNATYVLSGETGEDRIRLEANIGNEELQWYCNGRYLGASDRMRPLFLDLLPGQHQVSCMSASGQTAKVDFNVSAS
jgi:penicillin-binding protein 1C